MVSTQVLPQLFTFDPIKGSLEMEEEAVFQPHDHF